MTKLRTHYDNLKVVRNASAEAIRTAYKTLSQKHHPDRNGNSAESQRVMKIINASYAALSDPDERKKHDKWIKEQESKLLSEPVNVKKPAAANFPLPVPGTGYFFNLTDTEQSKILSRVSGASSNQYATALGDVLPNYFWCAFGFGLFIYIFSAASDYRWQDETILWYATLTTIAALLVGQNASQIHAWHSHPLKSWLIITPMYFMKLHLNKLWYWPIWTASHMSVSDKYKNGKYQYSVISVSLGGRQQKFAVSAKSVYPLLVQKIKGYEELLRMAIKFNDINYFIEHDDLMEGRLSPEKRRNQKATRIYAVGIYLTSIILASIFFIASYKLNQALPGKPDYAKTPTFIYPPQSAPTDP